MEAVRFGTEDGVSLEGEIRRPETPPVGSTVICHAHPRHGGSKDHPILWALRNDLASRGFVVLAFNFRGTMRSAGTYGAGHAETRDVDAAIGRVREDAAGPTLVCGWSFGANVALREALTDDRVGALALIGLPLEPGDVEIPPTPEPSELRSFTRPTLLLAGEGDVYCPRPRLESMARTMPKAEVVIVPGTDHFLWHREKAVAETVGSFAVRTLLSVDGRQG
jgi:alpha/beta superfamily hydrolase